MSTCEYCKQPANYQFKNKIFCCSKSISGCPEIKRKRKLACLEKYGDENFRNTAKSKSTKKERYGNETFNNREQAANTLLEVHGVTNVSQIPEVKEKKDNTFDKNYRRDNDAHAKLVQQKQATWKKKNIKSINAKRKKTRIDRGLSVPDHLLPDHEIYRRRVWEETNKNDLSVLVNYNKRGRLEYHLDHKYSITQGFLNRIPPEIIGHIANLEMLPHYENRAKYSKCSITIEQLYQLVESHRKGK
ncbi:MAG TPA: hypothetical protein VFM18_19125 [Methanosarcina sp.]|nr:hypothetical protein [Methanosarcina sp.]